MYRQQRSLRKRLNSLFLTDFHSYILLYAIEVLIHQLMLNYPL
uniref:Uncharacterized protein n=1 Tax=Schistosoma japonicum TaxID=6182 RepID=Q5C801_SCHJA|nr:unknown [Schistosoma japonicum]